MSISEWSTTPADNASAATGINWAEGQAPSTVNDSGRQMMADVATWYVQLVGAGMLFAQAAAPTGWTKDATTYDHALRLTSGTGAETAGTEDFSTVFAITATDTHALTEAELPTYTPTITIHDSGHIHEIMDPQHTHSGNVASGITGGGIPTGEPSGNAAVSIGSASTGITINSHTTGITATSSSIGSNTPHSHDINLKVKYYDLIRCTKDA